MRSFVSPKGNIDIIPGTIFHGFAIQQQQARQQLGIDPKTKSYFM